MRVSLGFYLSRSREIRVADFLFDGPVALLQEVVCHEFAHAAVDERYGRRGRPHGREWRSLMRLAGREPRVRIPGVELERLIPIGVIDVVAVEESDLLVVASEVNPRGRIRCGIAESETSVISRP